MSAKNLMDGLTAYADPEELASPSVMHEEQSPVLISISVITLSALTLGTF